MTAKFVFAYKTALKCDRRSDSPTWFGAKKTVRLRTAENSERENLGLLSNFQSCLRQQVL